MINEEINIAIAEHCGWRNIKEIDYQPIGTDPYIDGPDQMWVGIHPESDSDSDEYEVIPDYCNDLNLMHDVENTLKDPIQQSFYAEYLGDFNSFEKGEYPTFRFVNSTAKERAVAFLKVIGGWEK